MISKLYNFEQVSVALEWLHDLGVDEIISEFPLNRLDSRLENFPRTDLLDEKAAEVEISDKVVKKKFINYGENIASATAVDSLHEAQKLAESCENLEDLFVAISQFSGFSSVKRLLTSTVPKVKPFPKVLLLNEPEFLSQTEREIEREKIKQILFRGIFSSIGLTLENGKLGVLSFFPWKVKKDEVDENIDFELIEPFLVQHIKLIDPKYLIFVGADSWKLFEKNIEVKDSFFDNFNKRTLKIPSLDILISAPERKRLVWKDLVAFKVKLKEEGII